MRWCLISDDEFMEAVVMNEYDVDCGGARLRVRELGDPGGMPLLHFHGTPGSRLELAFADDMIRSAGLRVISFDRPGYGRSTPTPFSLTSVAKMAIHVADTAGIENFLTSGWSGGGPFALATAALSKRRVTAVGVIAGPGPFQMMPGALDALSDGDQAAVKLLPDQQAACEGFIEGFDLPLDSADALYEDFEPILSETDRYLWRLHSEELLTEVREAMNQGPWGCGWDNVAWIGPWSFDPTEIDCPVLLWYGTEDRMATTPHARWLETNVPKARLTLYEGHGHLLPFSHLEQIIGEMLAV